MSRDIAIVGMACVFPGAENLRRYWHNLSAGIDAVADIPAGRWPEVANFDLPSDHESHLPRLRGGFMPSGRRFDPLRFGVVPNVVKFGDADQFLMMQVIDEALQDAGVRDDDRVRNRTDVIIGRGGYLSNKMAEIYTRVDIITRLRTFLAARRPEMGEGELDELERELRSTLTVNDPDALATCIPNLVASRASNRLNLRGAAYTVDAACASSLIAVEHAVERLRHGDCDLAAACGIHLCQTPSFWYVFARLMTCSQSGWIRPFDRRADGLILGEGAGAVILKRVADALRDGDRVYAVIKGAGSASDGRETGVLAPASSGQVEAMRRATDDAGIDPDTIGLLEAHGTGTIMGDSVELESIRQFYGPRPGPQTRALGSVKSMLGHMMPAAGIAALIKASLALSNKVLPPSLHCEEPRPELAETAFYVNTQARPWLHPTGRQPRRAGVNAFGFGGINAHVVLEEVPHQPAWKRNAMGGMPTALRGHEATSLEDLPTQSRGHGASMISTPPSEGGEPEGRLLPRPVEVALPQPDELIVFGAPSPGELASRLERVETFLERDGTDASLADVASTLASELVADDPCKLVFLAPTIDWLRERLRLTRNALASGEVPPADPERVYYSGNAARLDGKVACLFPGLAFPGLIGDYPQHLLELCLRFPCVREEFDKVEFKDDHPDDPTPFSLILGPPPSLPEDVRRKWKQRVAPPRVDDSAAALTKPFAPPDRNLAGIGITLANWGSWQLLRRLEVPAHMLCGQSLGDYIALCAAGMVDFDRDVVPYLWDGLSVPATYVGQGRMAFVGMGEDRLLPLMADLDDTTICIHLSPETSIVGGESSQVLTLVRRLRDAGVMANTLPFPPGHTPRLTYLRQELMDAIKSQATVSPPQIPVYSAITVDLYPTDDDGVREIILGNLDHPVRFWQTNRRMYEDGARVFVQVGGGSLASNIKNQLPPDVLGTAVDVEYRSPVSQLHSLLATLLTAGASCRLETLYEHRRVRRLDFDRPQPAALPARTSLEMPMYWAPFQTAGLPPRAGAMPTALRGHGSSADVRDESSDFNVPVATSSEQVAMPTQSRGDGDQRVAGSSSACRLALLGEVREFVPGERLSAVRVLDLDEDLFLRDHLFVNGLPHKSVEECLPIMPMTVSVELMAEHAACLAPGLGLIGFEEIRAVRWIGFVDRRQVAVKVDARLVDVDSETGTHRVHVEMTEDGQQYASARVLFAPAYREELRLDFPPLENARAWPITAEEAYRDCHLFHGPTFYCLSELSDLADNGLLAKLVVRSPEGLFRSNPHPELLVDPCLLDAVGQVLGLWAQQQDAHILPVSVGCIEMYGPTPPPGTRMPIRIQIRNWDLDLKIVSADMEILDGDGCVWMRIQGWTDVLFRWPYRLIRAQLAPTFNCLAHDMEPPGSAGRTVCTFLTRRDVKNGNLEWLRRLFLSRREMDEMERLSADPERQWEFLLGRIAVKDAARLWIQRETNGPLLHPLALVVRHDERGRPYLESTDPSLPLPQVSLSHSEGSAAAVASPSAAGIDVEPLSRDTAAILDEFATEDEEALLDMLSREQPDDAWSTRLWCAKEAVGKRLGTGLGGAPRSFRLIDADERGRMLIHHGPTGESFPVTTWRNNAMILACSVDP